MYCKNLIVSSVQRKISALKVISRTTAYLYSPSLKIQVTQLVGYANSHVPQRRYISITKSNCGSHLSSLDSTL